jgi:hypothetical protein
MRDIKAEVRTILQATLKADNDQRERIHNHDNRIRAIEESLYDIKNIMNLKRATDKRND